MRSSISHLVSGFAGGALVLVGCVLTSTQRASEPQRIEPSVITTSAIRLVDAQGRLRAYLSSGADNPADGPRLMFFDERDQTQIWLGPREGMSPSLTLYRSSGSYALDLRMEETGEQSVALLGPNGEGEAALFLSKDGEASLQLRDRRGGTRVLRPETK